MTRTTFDTPPICTMLCNDIAGNVVIIEEYRLGVMGKFLAKTGSGVDQRVYSFDSLEKLKKNMQIDEGTTRCFQEVDEFKADKARLLNLLGDILYEAQNNPMRLVAFNSPLLGIAMIETWKARHPDATPHEIEEMAKQEYEFRAVIEANRKRDNGF